MKVTKKELKDMIKSIIEESKTTSKRRLIKEAVGEGRDWIESAILELGTESGDYDPNGFDEEEYDSIEAYEQEFIDGVRVSDSAFGYGKDIDLGSEEYMIFENSDDAYEEALARVKEDLDNEPELFTQDWLKDFITISDTDRRIISQEEADARYDEMSDDEIADEVGADIDDEDFDVDDAREELKDKLSDEIYDELEDPVQYFVEDQGIYSIEDLMKASFVMIDTDEAASDAVSTDGVAHFLNHYDGNETDLSNGAVAYRTN